MSRASTSGQDSSTTSTAARTAAIITAEYNSRGARPADFLHALFTEVGFPPRRRLARPCKMTVKSSRVHAPDHTRAAPRSAASSHRPQVQKSGCRRTSPAHRRLTRPASAIGKIDPWCSSRRWSKRSASCAIARIEPSNWRCHLAITFPESHGEQVDKWQRRSSSRAETATTREGGTLEYLSADLQEARHLTFDHLGISVGAGEGRGRQPSPFAGLRAEMYCEDMSSTTRPPGPRGARWLHQPIPVTCRAGTSTPRPAPQRA